MTTLNKQIYQTIYFIYFLDIIVLFLLKIFIIIIYSLLTSKTHGDYSVVR